MAIYVYECDKCKRKFEVRQGMNDPKFTNHRDVTEGHSGLKDVCEGTIHRLILGCAVIFKGTGWTPKFSNKTGHSLKKVDKALAAMGIEDASEGWSMSDEKAKEKEVKKPRRKKK